MKEELTREVLESMKSCDGTSCDRCEAEAYCEEMCWDVIVQNLATALLEEMDKPKVWDGAPKGTEYIVVGFYSNEKPLAPLKVVTCNREPPKTRARIMAEEISDKLNNAPRYKNEVDIIESALNKYADETRSEK